MEHSKNLNIQEETDFRKIADLIVGNYRLLLISLVICLTAGFAINRYSVPSYQISSSILIKGNNSTSSTNSNDNDFLYSNLFGGNQNLQNELWIMKSYPVIEKTISNLDLSVSYYSRGRFNYYETYKDAPFVVSYLPTHPQPINVKFNVLFLENGGISITAKSKKASFIDFSTNSILYRKERWTFNQLGKLGEIIETPDLAFIIQLSDTASKIDSYTHYAFSFSTITSLSAKTKNRLQYTIVDRQATVINISLMTESPSKGIDILNELMNVYSDQNLERKNHLATITIDYIEKQLDEIADSLDITEDNLQRFRTSNQLLNITDQATAISVQYNDLQNQIADLISKKRYYDYVSDLLKNNSFSNMMLPAAIGIPDPMLNNLITELINAQAQRSNLIESNQEKNPLVQKLGIQIENLKKTISESIAALSSTTSISIDEMTKRIKKTEYEINRLPATQRQLGNIERKYRLNDAILNYLMEKHAEAKITKASNMPDDVVIEPAKIVGDRPITPNKPRNYLVAMFLGLALPMGYILIKGILNNKVHSQDEIERITDKPLLGKIMHNHLRTKNVMFEFPKSIIAESMRALRTNLDFYVRGGQKKVILVTSCFENEGKSFIAQNLAMSYAQLGRRTILVDCDLRKPKIYFKEGEECQEGLSSFMIDKKNIDEITLHSPHEKLDYILSGILPPNPVELLALDKTELLLRRLKDIYDIIILDTTPLAQVTDAYLLLNHSDIKILVVRYGQTIKNVFSIVMKDLSQKNISNICIVLNDNKVYRDQYGYGYGYYNKKGFFKKKMKRRNHRMEKPIST